MTITQDQINNILDRAMAISLKSLVTLSSLLLVFLSIFFGVATAIVMMGFAGFKMGVAIGWDLYDIWKASQPVSSRQPRRK